MASAAIGGIDPARVAVVLGTGIGGLHTMHEQHNQLTEGGPTRVNPLTVPMLIPDAAAGQVAIDMGLHGGAHTPVSACASGAEAMMLAQMLLNDGRADLVLAGGGVRDLDGLAGSLDVSDFEFRRGGVTLGNDGDIAIRLGSGGQLQVERMQLVAAGSRLTVTGGGSLTQGLSARLRAVVRHAVAMLAGVQFVWDFTMEIV